MAPPQRQPACTAPHRSASQFIPLPQQQQQQRQQRQKPLAERGVLKRVCLAFAFHVAAVAFSVVLAVLLCLTIGGAGLVLLCICSGSSRSVRVLVAALWRAELWINSLGVDGAKRRNIQSAAAQRGDSAHLDAAIGVPTTTTTGSSTSTSSLPATETTRQSTMYLRPQQRGREVTASVMVLSLLYFLLFKWLFNLVFSVVPLAFWTLALAQFAPSAVGLSDAAALVDEGSSTGARCVVGIAFGLLAHQISVTAAAASVFMSDKMAGFLFAEARCADDDPGHAPLLHWNHATHGEVPTHTLQYYAAMTEPSVFDANRHSERRASMAPSATQSAATAYALHYDNVRDYQQQQQQQQQRGERSDRSRGPVQSTLSALESESRPGSSSSITNFVPPMPPMPPIPPAAPFMPYPPFSDSHSSAEQSFRRDHAEARDVDCCLFNVRIERTNNSGQGDHGGGRDSGRDGGRGVGRGSGFPGGLDVFGGSRGGGRGGGFPGGLGIFDGGHGSRGLLQDGFRGGGAMREFHGDARLHSAFDPRVQGPLDPFSQDPRMAAAAAARRFAPHEHQHGHDHHRLGGHHHAHHPHGYELHPWMRKDDASTWSQWRRKARNGGRRDRSGSGAAVGGRCELKRTKSFDSCWAGMIDEDASLPPHMQMCEVLDLSPSAPPLLPTEATYATRSDRAQFDVPFARSAASAAPLPLRMRKSNSDEGAYRHPSEFAGARAHPALKMTDFERQQADRRQQQADRQQQQADRQQQQADRQQQQIDRQRQQIDRQRQQIGRQQQQADQHRLASGRHVLPVDADAPPTAMSPTSYRRELDVYAKDRDYHHEGIAQAALDGIEQAKKEGEQLAASGRSSSTSSGSSVAVTAVVAPVSRSRIISRPITSSDSSARVTTASTADTRFVPSDQRRISFTGPYQAGAPASVDVIDREIHGQFGSVPRTFEENRFLTSFGAPGQSSSETITTVNDTPLYRGWDEDPRYDAFASPLSAGNGSFLDASGATDAAGDDDQDDDDAYDAFSLGYSAVDRVVDDDDDDAAFPSDQLPQVYRSIRYTGPPSRPQMRFSEIDDVPGQRDKVHFNAFAPPSVAPSPSPFHYTVWAFLLSQRSEMRERAEQLDATSRRLTVDTKLDIRRGALVHVTLEVPDGFRIRNGATQGFSWEGKVCNATFDVECTHGAGFGSVLFKATIIVGTEVAVLRSYVSVSNKQLEPSELEAQMLPSDLEVLEKTFEEIPYASLELQELVGTGHFGDAYRAKYNGRDVVVKTIRASEFGATTEQIVNEFQHEAAVLNMFGHHPCVVPFVGASTDIRFPLSIVTQYLPYGSLEDNLRREASGSSGGAPSSNAPSSFTLGEKTLMLKDAAAGLLNIHEGGFIHRDIAARNCLVDNNLRVKICDFGLCRRVSATGGTLLQSGVGPVKYMAPESLLPPHLFSYESDSYMFGVLMWETFTMSSPFASLSPLEAVLKVMNGERLAVPQGLPASLQSLMESCFHDSPAQRPSMVEILSALDDVSTATLRRDKVAAGAVAAASASLTSSIELRPGRSSVFV